MVIPWTYISKYIDSVRNPINCSVIGLTIEVVDEDNSVHSRIHLLNGNVNEKVAPFPSELFSAHIVPP